MARISYSTFQETEDLINNDSNMIKLFGLKNHGDEAIVRIMHDSVEDFDIVTTHNVKVGEKYRKISCIRDPREPIDNCPLCKAGERIQQRMFIHLLVYSKNPDGSITYQPMVWERSAGEYAKKLQTFISEYGPLSECVFKIKRNGAARSMDTTYELLYCPPNIYTPQLYIIDKTPFENYTACGKIVLDKNFDEINQFLATGAFPNPNRSNNESNAPNPQVNAPTQQFTNKDAVPYAPSVTNSPPQPVQPTYTPVTSVPFSQPNVPNPYPTVTETPMPSSYTPEGAPPARPTRYY